MILPDNKLDSPAFLVFSNYEKILMWNRSALESPTVKTALSIRSRPGDPYNVRLPSRPLKEEETLKLQNLLTEFEKKFNNNNTIEQTLVSL